MRLLTTKIVIYKKKGEKSHLYLKSTSISHRLLYFAVDVYFTRTATIVIIIIIIIITIIRFLLLVELIIIQPIGRKRGITLWSGSKRVVNFPW